MGALSEAQGHAGGIWIMVERNRNFSISVVDVLHQAVIVEISRGNKKWFFLQLFMRAQFLQVVRIFGITLGFSGIQLQVLGSECPAF